MASLQVHHNVQIKFVGPLVLFISRTPRRLENGEGSGGYGGGIFTGTDSISIFEVGFNLAQNTAASGGSLYNLGATYDVDRSSSPNVRDNQAVVRILRTRSDALVNTYCDATYMFLMASCTNTPSRGQPFL